MIYFNLAMCGVVYYFICLFISYKNEIKDKENGDGKVRIHKFDIKVRPNLLHLCIFIMFVLLLNVLFV